ncbi:MAG TPA: type I-C CRISPR-associated protein Cas8c/Csd1 [Propionibacteriaceae bacterium]
MLLTRLADYARVSKRDAPPYYKDKLVRYVLELNRDGTLASPRLTSLANPAQPRMKNGVVHTVPSIVKTSGIAPTLAVDTCEYMFGWVDETTKKPQRVEQMHQRFRALVDQWVEMDPAGPGRALKQFYADGHVARLSPEPGWSRADVVAVRVAGRFLHATESAQRFWKSVAEGRKTSGRTGLCLVCGEPGALLQSIPQQVPMRLVPGATQSASLISVNKATHGFDLREQLVHTPICDTCGLLVMNALERLLDQQWTSTVVGQGTRLAWWTTGSANFDLGLLDEPPTPHEVAHVLSSAARGSALGEDEARDWETFCALAVSGNVSRVVVREWIENPLPDIMHNLRKWFSDHEMIDGWSGETRQVGLGRMVYVAGRWARGKGGSSGSYAKLGASGADRPEGLYWGLMRSALLGAELPPKLLAHLVRRVRLDGRVDAERAALMRLALRRRLSETERGLYMPVLNPENNEPAYLAGRIFAVLEDIQLSAARANGDDPPNTTFADKYWGRAATSPAVALLAGSRNARAWLKRMRPKKPAWAEAARQRLEDLSARLAQAGGPPHGSNLAEKSAFVLGYYQQCAELRSARKTPPAENASA